MNGIADNDKWAAAEQELANMVKGFTVKLTIATRDTYAKFGFVADRPVYVDLTLSHSSADVRRSDSPADNDLETQAENDARAMLEIVCRQASELLQANLWSMEDLIAMWRGTKFEPAGYCNQIRGIASSPLDAVARYLQMRVAA